MKPTLMVLAAGMGSRYGGLKQVEPVGPNSEIILEYSIYDALQAGFDKVVFVIRRDIEDTFRQHVGSRLEGKIAVEYAFQELDSLPEGFQVPEGRSKPWGTGHAILVAKDAIAEPFAAINADDFYGREGFELLAGHFKQEQSYAMVGFQLRNTVSPHGSVSRGICTTTNSHLKTVVEHPTIFSHQGTYRSENPDAELKGNEVVSMNFWGFTPDIFTHLQDQFCDFLQKRGDEARSEFYIPAVVDRLIAEGKKEVKVLTTTESWFGVTYPEDRPVVVNGIKELVSSGRYPEKLWN